MLVDIFVALRELPNSDLVVIPKLNCAHSHRRFAATTSTIFIRTLHKKQTHLKHFLILTVAD